MNDYQRILALVDFDRDGAAVVRRASRLTRLGQAELALLHLIEPDPNLDGGYPMPSRTSLRDGYEQAALRRLGFLAASLDAGEAVHLARYGRAAEMFAEGVAAWRPDLVIAAADPGYLSGRHDLLILGRHPVSGGRLARLFGNLLPHFAGRCLG
jgi:nucleotide-binding universal stress UspA family protein